jgi:hypothetical protein
MRGMAGDPAAGGQIAIAAELDLHGAPQPLGQDERPGCVRVRYQHRELLAPDTRGVIKGARLLPQHEADALECSIALLVAALVVVALEPVEVEDQHAERCPCAPRPRQLCREHLVERAPVRQPGQRIGVSGGLKPPHHALHVTADPAQRECHRAHGPRGHRKL